MRQIDLVNLQTTVQSLQIALQNLQTTVQSLQVVSQNLQTTMQSLQVVSQNLQNDNAKPVNCLAKPANGGAKETIHETVSASNND